MKLYLTIPILAILGSLAVLSLFSTAAALSQVVPYSEEYMQQHDGGDRAEYLQEVENGDPWMYVPPANDVSGSAVTSDVPAN